MLYRDVIALTRPANIVGGGGGGEGGKILGPEKGLVHSKM